MHLLKVHVTQRSRSSKHVDPADLTHQICHVVIDKAAMYLISALAAKDFRQVNIGLKDNGNRMHT